MSYSDFKTNVRTLGLVAPAESLGTASNATVSAVTPAVLPTFPRRMKITGIKLVCTTIPNASATNLIAQFRNGATNVLGQVTLTTATVGQVLTGTVTAAYTTFTANQAAPQVWAVGTATASADALGAYDVFLETQELYAE